MKTGIAELEKAVGRMLPAEIAGATGPSGIAWACAWLEACGYPGVKLLIEALRDERRDLELVRDGLGLDLKGMSCVWLAPHLMAEVECCGRVFLRNVRHGLYLLPFTVSANIGIGCPVDQAFALGGVRTSNPYSEKLALAEAIGVEVDDELWRLLQGRS